MAECRRFQQFGFLCLILATFCGIVGFVIVYHYAQFERPIQQFAIVIDAGSTQTRSSLFSVGIDVSSLIDWTNEIDDKNGDTLDASSGVPLTELFRIRQVDTCVNGGPLANIESEQDANELAFKCIKKFSKLIKKLDFEAESRNQNNIFDEEYDEIVLDSDEVSEQMALLNHRVNSVTHLYIGATAGMRAIEQLNKTSADEKLHWMNKAINGSQGLVENGPHINKAYVGVLSGSDEAAFGWTSVNFVCNNLEAQHKGLLEPTIYDSSNQSSVVYTLAGDNSNSNNNNRAPQAKLEIESVGTLEAGGASIQLAYQVPDNYSKFIIQMNNLEEQKLDLFNGKYHLVTRSDLCLGMSQAILRAYYILLWQHFRQSTDFLAGSIVDSQTIEIENPCLQKAAQISLTKDELKNIFSSPCLSVSKQLKNQAALTRFNTFIESKNVFRFSGLGDTLKCNVILLNLIEPALCKNYFSICPNKKINQKPPANMPFVTISGYNKALQVLGLPKKASNSVKNSTIELEQIIADKLGGYSIDHGEYLKRIKAFCSIDVAEFPVKFPKMNKLYYAVNCLQLIYINKLLTEFYHFEPNTSWNQIKFLLFPVKPKKQAEVLDNKDEGKKSRHEDKKDIGWTLGLLLNATSSRFSNFGTLDGQTNDSDVFFHHGATTMFIVRTTIFLMFACCLTAICCLFIGAIVVHHQRKAKSGAYSVDTRYGGASS